MPLKEDIRKFALQNAISYNGRANPGAVIGRILGIHEELRGRTKEVMKQVQDAIKEINKMGLDEQRAELESTAPELLEKKESEKKGILKELEGAEKGVVMRFAPSPSGPMHIGHAITGGLTCLYARKYGGKFILRIEDTNPDNIDPDAYTMLPEEAGWIFGNVSEVCIQSDRMKIYYKYIERLLNLGAAYVCTCSQEKFKEYSSAMENCPCRQLPAGESLKRWGLMLDKNGLKEGAAVVRFRSDMRHENPAMRDFPLARINETRHPRQGTKYRVWPLMNLCVAVDDIESGMTHIIRAKDHMDNAKRQEMMYKALGAKFPRTYFSGRINFIDLELSCSKTKARIRKGEFSGWCDIRLPFLCALRKRGYQPGAFLKYAQLMGISPVDKTVSADEFFKAINSFNKEIIDPLADRYFLIREPVKVAIKDAPKQDIELDLHPKLRKGGRKFKTDENFYIEKSDFEALRDKKLYRLMDCLNFTKKGNQLVFTSLGYEDFKNSGERIMHWLPQDDVVDVEVLMADASIVRGICEKGVSKLKVNDIVQFERHFFARLDKKERNKSLFWFTHR